MGPSIFQFSDKGSWPCKNGVFNVIKMHKEQLVKEKIDFIKGCFNTFSYLSQYFYSLLHNIFSEPSYVYLQKYQENCLCKPYEIDEECIRFYNLRIPRSIHQKIQTSIYRSLIDLLFETYNRRRKKMPRK